MSQGQIFTVSQLNNYIKSILFNNCLLQDIRVVGEISNFKLHRPSGHMYFTLKDQESILRCVFFRSKNQGLNFLPTEGMKVVARGSISLYERSGYFQLYVEELDPEGLGALFMAFQKLKEKLQGQGLFEPQNKKPLPRIPRKIGLITSPSGAAVRDFLTTLGRRFPCVRVIIYPVAVQGRESPPQIIKALKKLDSLGNLDVIVLARGGGSLEELWSFNDEGVARAIFSTRAPVVSAVGHETDFTIADFVADRRASTPTAAAEIITPELSGLLDQLDAMEQRLKGIWKSRLQEKMAFLNRLSSAVSLKYTRDKINHSWQRTDELWQRLARSISYSIKLKSSELKNLGDKLKALNPEKVMARGFVYVTDKDEKLVRSVDGLKIRDDLNIVFRDGKAFCRVRGIQKGNICN